MNPKMTAAGVAFQVVLKCARAQILPQFDVASVKVNRDGGDKWNIETPSGGRFRATGISARSLIMNAFRYHPPSAFTWAAWIESERFDIEARTTSRDQITHDQMGGCCRLLQSVLADRFGLKYHRETREARGYSLTVAKDGPKLTKNTGHEIGIETRRGRVKGYNEPSAHLPGSLGCSSMISSSIRPVWQRFDFTLEWAYDGDPEPNDPSIFSALQEQLGLKLVPRKGPIECLVIDHIARPSED